jgi:hypothetical protein
MHQCDTVIIGPISTTELNRDPLDPIPDILKKWMHIISKGAANHLPEHRHYDHAIDLTTS